ncbi:MAG: helix-hairpin-helix domain-containing protein [Armatimonadota bacterium]|nr:MAG: helix-hairpin-helix domain-containing protein [Armatimonadota bacterium]
MFFFSRGEQVALALLLAALLGAAGVMWWTGSRAGEPAEPFFVDAPTASSGEKIEVHVCGEVAKPGLYAVTPGTRAHEAIEAAGGATERADLSAINLAAEVVDGQQVMVPVRAAADDQSSEPPSASRPAATHPASPGRSTTKTSLNRAGVDELNQLPGIGPTYARRIIEYRERLKAETGRGFTRVEQLMEVPGIGPKRFADIKDRVTL